MNKKPQITVVIPAYNEERLLAGCLKSLQKQTFKDFEIIVVDNNSTDKTAKIAKSFGTKVVKQPIQGITPARNKGYNEASGKIIARTDADSKVPPNWLKQIYGTFRKNPKVVAITGNFSFPDESKTTAWFLELFVDAFVYKFTKLLIGHYPISGPNNAILKSAWKEIKDDIHNDDSVVHEDIDLSCHLYKIGDIIYLREVKTTYSLRRWRRNFFYTLFEYGLRYLRTVFIHHPCFLRHKRDFKTN